MARSKARKQRRTRRSFSGSTPKPLRWFRMGKEPNLWYYAREAAEPNDISATARIVMKRGNEYCVTTNSFNTPLIPINGTLAEAKKLALHPELELFLAIRKEANERG